MKKSVSSELTELARRLTEVEEVHRLRESLRAGGMASVDGVRAGAVALLAASMASNRGTLVLVVADRSGARATLNDLRLFMEPDARLAWLPPWDRVPEFSRSLSDTTSGERLRVFQSLSSSEPPAILVAPIEAFLQPIPDRNELEQEVIRFVIGDTLEESRLLERLTSRGFVSQPAVEIPYEIAIRGGLIDLSD